MSEPVDFTQITPYRTPDESPGYLLWRTSISWRRAIEEKLKPLHLTHPQFVILASVAWLTKTSELVSQIDIANQAGLDPNTTSQILRGLEAKKLIMRLQTKNERNKNPVLTEEGAKALKEAMLAVERVNTQFFAPLKANQSELVAALQKLLN